MNPKTLLLLMLYTRAAWPRVVRVPQGPLLRVDGTEVSIPCDVSDYEGPAEQNFEWLFSSDGSAGLGVLSTWDPSFTHPAFSDRVTSGGIQLQRISPNRVLLRILQLRATDAGTYTCSTPSTDATVRGNYEDRVQLKVLPDTLRVAGAKGRLVSTRNVTVGGSFQLSCHAASSETPAHTHLSLTWERRTGAVAVEVLTLTHLGRIQPGSEYESRYGIGEVGLGTAGADGFRLTVNRAESADAGEYSCSAATWVPGPDGWEKIQEKRVPIARVDVRPIGVSIKALLSDVQISEGLPLNLSCLVSADSDGPVLTRVRWLLSPESGEPRELPGGPEPDLVGTNAGIYQLLLPRTWDSGNYSCQATAWIPHGNGTWHPAAEAESEAVRVLVLPPEADLAVSLSASLLPLSPEEPTELLCRVAGPEGARLSVSWYHSPSSPPGARLVGSLDQDWTLRVGEEYRQRMDRGELIFLRRDPQTFVMRIQWTTEADRGSYRCVGIAWGQQRNDSWGPSAEVPSSPADVYWEEEEPSLAVNAQLTKLVPAAGGTFEMLCAVSAANIPSPRYSVQVTLDRPLPGPAGRAPVISLSHDGLTRRGTEGTGDAALEKVKPALYRFTKYRAQTQDTGAYRCAITAWTQGGGGAWREVRNQTSNPVPLEFQTSGPVFNVTAHTDRSSVYAGERAEFWCIISTDGPATDPEDVAFEVSWFAERLGGGAVPLVLVDRAAQVRSSGRNGTSEVALERVSDMEYRLRIYGCEEGDAGGHYCAVTPWVRSGEGGWNQQEAIRSNLVSISVRMDLLSTFRYPLLIGVGLSLLAGLLSCLIGYCSSRLCCKTQPKQDVRREHRRLMAMEMD